MPCHRCVRSHGYTGMAANIGDGSRPGQTGRRLARRGSRLPSEHGRLSWTKWGGGSSKGRSRRQSILIISSTTSSQQSRSHIAICRSARRASTRCRAAFRRLRLGSPDFPRTPMFRLLGTTIPLLTHLGLMLHLFSIRKLKIIIPSQSSQVQTLRAREETFRARISGGGKGSGRWVEIRHALGRSEGS